MKENFPSEKAILLLSIDKGNFYGREISLNKSSPFFVVIIIIVAPFCLLPSKSMRSVIGVLIGRPLLLLLQQPMSMLSSTASTTYLYLDYPSIKIKCSGRKTLFKVAKKLLTPSPPPSPLLHTRDDEGQSMLKNVCSVDVTLNVAQWPSGCFCFKQSTVLILSVRQLSNIFVLIIIRKNFNRYFKVIKYVQSFKKVISRSQIFS